VLLERVEGDTLLLRGTDLIDGTPILDIKPVHNDITGVLGAPAARPFPQVDPCC